MEAITDNWGMFASGYWKSLQICLWGLVGSLVLGTLIAACRVSPIAPLRAFGTAWVNLIRNCPLTVVLFVFAFGLPILGFNASYMILCTAGLVVYTSAFVCEALRSGINAVPAGQAEAARAIGLPFTGTLREVILPQAFKSCLPPLGSVLIAMFKNSAIVGAFGIAGDLYSVGQTLTSSRGYPVVPSMLGVAAGYLMITLPAAALLATLERKVAIVR